MIAKKELLIYTSDKLNHSGDYSALWKQISSKFNFVRVVYEGDDKESKPLEQNIIAETNIKYTNKYSSSKPDYKIIWSLQNEYILINNTWEYGKIFIIPDYSTPYRYFIGFEFNSGYSSNKVAGMVVYFDPEGNMISTKTKIIPRNLLIDYDWRNGIINCSKSAFFKQTLMFTQSHRDTNNLIININLLDFDDNIICQSNEFTQLKTTWNDYTNVQTMLKYPRFFHFTSYSDDKQNNNKQINILIDLGSLKLLKNHTKENTQSNGYIYKFEPLNYLSLDYYISDSEQDNLEEFCQQANFYELEEFTDGYPDKCIVCNKKTAEATFEHNNMFMGLGNSFCLGCQIRYSKSNNVWECCKLKKGFREGEINLCSNNLSSTNNYQCDNSSHLEKYRLNICDSNSKSNFQEIVNGVVNGVVNGMVDGIVDSITEYIGVFAKKKIHVSPCEIK